MRTFVTFLAALAVIGCSESPAASATPGFDMRVVKTGLANPWEIISGPDGWLWVTEKSAGRVVRINPADGTTRVAATISEAVITPRTQDGLLGMALRLPDVYLAYSYGTSFKITRYVYDQTTATLRHGTDVLTDLPVSPDHNSGRLALGPDDKLYYTIGDQGNNQFGRFCRPNRAQDLPTSPTDRDAYQGKVLRMELDGSVPADNPVLAGVRSHVWSYGHRNAQGLVFAGSRLYSSEQGPKTDDEINQIRGGGNYGWPRVSGFRDDKAYAYANWSATRSCSTLTFSDYDVPASVPRQTETSFRDPALSEPVHTVGTVPNSFNFKDARCEDSYHMCWPTVAPASLDHYGADAIPGWRNSLLMPALKDGTVHRLPLSPSSPSPSSPSPSSPSPGSASPGSPSPGSPSPGSASPGSASPGSASPGSASPGSASPGSPSTGSSASGGSRPATGLVPELRTVNRYRDVAVSPDGRTIYVATDSAGTALTLDGRPTSKLANPGAILAFHPAPRTDP